MSINFFVLVNIEVQFYLILPLILMSVKSINRVKSIDFGYSSLYNAKYREKMQVTCSRYINSGPRAGDRSWSPPTEIDISRMPIDRLRSFLRRPLMGADILGIHGNIYSVFKYKRLNAAYVGNVNVYKRCVNIMIRLWCNSINF